MPDLDFRRESHAPQSVKVNGITYDSLSEAVCSALLERHIPGWKPVVGESVHIDIGFKRTADFKVDGVVVEFHPIFIGREMHDRSSYYRLKNALMHIPKFWREEIVAAQKAHLLSEYTRKRRWALDFSGHGETELVVAENHMEFYDRVLRRFSTDPPRRDQYAREWYRLTRELSRAAHSDGHQIDLAQLEFEPRPPLEPSK